MMKVSTAQGKLDRINGQMNLARSEIDAINGEIKVIEDSLTQELGKVTVNNETIEALESKRSALTASRDRLTARITALETTIPTAQDDLDRAELDQATKDRKTAVTKVNDTLTMWRARAGNVADLEAIAVAAIGSRQDLAKLTSKIEYLSEVLGEPRPILAGADHLNRSDLDTLRVNFRRACKTELSPYTRNEFDEKLKALNGEKRESGREIVRARKHAESVAAGW